MAVVTSSMNNSHTYNLINTYVSNSQEISTWDKKKPYIFVHRLENVRWFLPFLLFSLLIVNIKRRFN